MMKALKMEGRMDSWNDERLDELGRRVDDGFRAARNDLASVKDELKAEMGEGKGALGDLNKRFDRLHFALTGAGLTFGVTILGTLGGVLVRLA